MYIHIYIYICIYVKSESTRKVFFKGVNYNLRVCLTQNNVFVYILVSFFR